MTILIINADDFGYCESVNYGIISAHQFGLVKSTTMMANMPAVEHGVQLLKQYPTLHCGVHLTLSCGHPLLEDHQTIVNEEGVFYKRLTPDVLATFNMEEVYREFCAQIEKVKSLGIEISHLD
ncbi:MAG: ChbG/HpnK family deacetylase, partial [Turicibacter sp.]